MTPRDTVGGPGRLKLFVTKDEHKFSCAHMTIFPDGTKERLHGHNFRVGLAVELDTGGGRPMLDFARIKQELAALCAELREHLLLPAHSEAVRVLSERDGTTEVEVCGARYAFPSEDVLFLPIPNVVVEHLAAYLCSTLGERLAGDFARSGVVALEVTVTEGPGQGASFAVPVAFAPGGAE